MVIAQIAIATRRDLASGRKPGLSARSHRTLFIKVRSVGFPDYLPPSTIAASRPWGMRKHQPGDICRPRPVHAAAQASAHKTLNRTYVGKCI